jgi:hypothetical protein
MNDYANFSDLVGKTLIEVTVLSAEDEIYFTCDDGTKFHMYHSQDCCESVTIEDICGDLDSLIGSPIVMAEESSSNDNPKGEYSDSFTWTFYKIATSKGYVTIRWYGESNGYYSESVDFSRISKDQ